MEYAVAGTAKSFVVIYNFLIEKTCRISNLNKLYVKISIG